MSPEEADALAAELLGELVTTLGGRHIAHARRIAAAVSTVGDDRAVMAALLHDVLEKTPTTADELLARTGDADLVRLVQVLTQRPGEPYPDYLGRCASDPTALVVKRIDIADKLVADDSTVPPAVAERIKHQAGARLASLDWVAQHAATSAAAGATPTALSPPALG